MSLLEPKRATNQNEMSLSLLDKLNLHLQFIKMILKVKGHILRN